MKHRSFNKETKIVHDQLNYENQIEKYDFKFLQDHVETYLKDFISLVSPPLFDCECDDQFFDELLIYFKIFILLMYIQEIQLVSQWLAWLNWKFDVT